MITRGLIIRNPDSPVFKVGDRHRFTVEEKTSESGKTWTKIRTAKDGEGVLYEVVSVQRTNWKGNDKGQISFNLELDNELAQLPRAQPVQTHSEPAEEHAMRAGNLLYMCHSIMKRLTGDEYDHEDARSLFIYMSREGYIKTMPVEPFNEAAPEEKPF